MRLKRKDLEWAADEGLLSPDQVGPLWKGLEARSDDVELNFETAAYALGGVLVLAALSWFTTRAWQLWGDGILTGLLAGYVVAFVAIGRELRFGRDLRLPGDLLLLIASAIVPVAAIGLLRTLGLWDTTIVPPNSVVVQVQLQAIGVALTGAGFGAILLKWAPSPLLLLPVLIGLATAVMEAGALAFGTSDLDLFAVRRTLGGLTGILFLVMAVRLDHEPGEADWGLWGHVVGVVLLWGALTTGNSDDQFVRFLYFLANIVLIVFSVLLRRSIYIVAGALGALIYLVSLAGDLFQNSILFPAVLVVIGIGVILGGASYRKRRDGIEALAQRAVPEGLRRLLPPPR